MLSPCGDEPGSPALPFSIPNTAIEKLTNGHAENNPTSIITGMFSAMTQDEAEVIVISIGGTVEANPSETTNYAVVGSQLASWNVARFETHSTRMLGEKEFLEFIIEKGNEKHEYGNDQVQSLVKSEESDSASGIKKEEQKVKSE